MRLFHGDFLGVGLRTNRLVFLVLLAMASLLVGCGDDDGEPVTEFADYATRGEHPVGFRVLEATNDGEPLAIKAWYPANTAAGSDGAIAYTIALKFPGIPTDPPAVVNGRAIEDAAPDLRDRRPIVIFSHGYVGNPEWYATLVEHYASHGFVVLAPEHREDDWFAAWAAAIDRPRDIRRTLDFAEALNGPGGAFEDGLDLDHIALVGHSFGGYTALAMAGARLDLDPLEAGCATISESDPKAILCAAFVGHQDDMAMRAGLSATPEGQWPSLGDARIRAIVPIAGDAYPFDAGLASITVPMMAIGGTADTGTPWDWGAELSYMRATSPFRALVGLEGGGHMLAVQDCETMPWTDLLPELERGYICTEPAWTKPDAHAVIAGFSTAFLRDVLGESGSAHRALTETTIAMPSVLYSVTTPRGRAARDRSVSDSRGRAPSRAGRTRPPSRRAGA